MKSSIDSKSHLKVRAGRRIKPGSGVGNGMGSGKPPRKKEKTK